MYTAERIGTGITIIIAAIVLFLMLIVQFGPSLSLLDPTYREAHATCESIKNGMTYDEVKAKVGHLFVNGPETYIDDNGDGQAWLLNNVKSIQVACNIRFEAGRVIFAQMMNEGSF